MAYPVSITNEVDPVSRIEGHLGVAVTTSDGTITDAFAHGNLWRGFENFLLGRDANDAITFVQRICGVCPVPHGMTSTYAVDTVLGYSAGHITFADDSTNGVPKKAVSIRNLVLGAEFLMSSITHFYHLAAPSYIQGPAIPPWTPYFDDTYYTEIDPVLASMRSHGKVTPAKNGTDGFSDGLWSTVIRSYVVALRIRRLTFEAGALFAGRMPMTSVYVGGGVTFDGTEDLTARANMFADIMKEVGHFIIEEYVPIALALSVLYSSYDNVHNAGGGIGSGLGRYLAWGAFPNPDTDVLTIQGGFKDINPTPTTHSFTVANKAEVASKFLASTGSNTESVKDMLTEDIGSSRYEVAAAQDSAAYNKTTPGGTANMAAYPGDVSRTKPKRANGYTYMKAPRWGGVSAEVGPLARMMVSGLFQDNVALATSLGAYYTAYVKDLALLTGGTANLNPAMVSADIAVVLLRAGLATVRNATVAGALSLPVTHDFTYAEIVANIAALAALLGTTGAHATVAAAYIHADTLITGTIANHVVGLKAGASTMDRLRARAIESLFLVQQILGIYAPATGGWSTQANRGSFSLASTSWIGMLKAETGGANDTSTSTWKVKSIPAGTHQGWGGTEAPRGALMHQATINNGKITKYQCIVPTTWNGSPVVGPSAVKLNHGAIEAAVIGAPFASTLTTFAGQTGSHTAAGGVEVLRVAQSFDPCIACAVH